MKKLNKKGFTLIEVVLVLAIGGLIFLLAFLAFQQASKNRRDTQRRTDAGRMISELANASGDGNKVTDSNSLKSFLTKYMGGSDTGFTSNNITYMVTYGTADPGQASGPGAANMSINQGSCNGSTITAGTGGYAVIVGLEKGTACRDDK